MPTEAELLTTTDPHRLGSASITDAGTTWTCAGCGWSGDPTDWDQHVIDYEAGES